MATPGTYLSIAAYSGLYETRVICAEKEVKHTIVHDPDPELDIYKINFNEPNWIDHVLAHAMLYRPHIISIGSWPGFARIIEPLKRILGPDVKIILELKSPLLLAGKKLEQQQSRFDKVQECLDGVIAPTRGMCDSWFPELRIPFLEHRSILNKNLFGKKKISTTKVFPKKFVFYGSLEPKREINELLKYISKIPRIIERELSFSFYGTGNDIDRLKEHVIDLNMVDHIKFYGALPQNELFQKLSNYDAGIAWVPKNLYDGAPSLKLIEYCAAKLIPIATNNRGHLHLQKYGIDAKFFSQDEDSFLSSIEDILINGVPRTILNSNKKISTEFDYKNVISNEIKPFFEKTLASKSNIHRLTSSKKFSDSILGKKSNKPIENVIHWLPNMNTFCSTRESNDKVCIAGILSDRLRRGLDSECRLIDLKENDWTEKLSDNKVDLILIESCIEAANGDWSHHLIGKVSAEVRALIKKAKLKKIPVVFWATTDVSYMNLYSEICLLTDNIFVSDQRSLVNLPKSKAKPVYIHPCFQPRLFNKLRPIEIGQQDFARILVNGIRTVELDTAISNTVNLNPHLRFTAFERRLVPTRNYISKADTMYTNLNAKGKVSEKYLPEVLKNADIILYSESGRNSQTELCWQAVENSACGLLTVRVTNDESANKELSPLIKDVADYHELSDLLNSIVDNPLKFSVKQLSVWRHVYQEHTFENAMHTILSKLKIKSAKAPVKKVTVISPTLRIDRLPTILKNFERQDYTQKNLVIIVNGDYKGYQAAERKLKGRKDIIIKFLPEDFNAGTALNIGVKFADGDYVFRFDDDDDYGRDYLTDMILTLKADDADVLGKFGSFIREIGKKEIYFRKQSSIERCNKAFDAKDLDHEHAALSGATFGVRRTLLEQTPFPNDRLAAADTSLLECLRRDKPSSRVIKIDWFNYTIGRSVNSAEHTWHVEWDHLVDKNIEVPVDIKDIP